MKRFIEGVERTQSTLFPERLEDWIGEDNAVRVVDVFVDELDLGGLGFDRVEPLATGRPGYHPCDLLKLYIYGTLNRVQSSRRLEREARRNVEVMWLTGRLVPDHKTIADFGQGQWPGDPQGLRPVRRAVPPARAVRRGQRGERWQQVQGGQRPGQELHAGQDGAPHGADRGERRAQSTAARQRRPARAVAGADDQDRLARRQDCDSQGGDAVPEGA